MSDWFSTCGYNNVSVQNTLIFRALEPHINADEIDYDP